MNHQKHIGIIVFYLPNKGYGYVRLLNTREEFHFKEKHLHDAVKAGDQVCFKIKKGKQGYFADAISLSQLI